MTVYIATRHPGSIAWLHAKGIEGENFPHFVEEDCKLLKPGDLVVGNLPMPLIKAVIDTGARFGLVNLPKVAFEQRGKELTPEEITEAGGRVIEILDIRVGEWNL